MTNLSGKPRQQKPVIINSSINDYGNDPYFVKKAAESKEFLDKHGFPQELLDKKRAEREV